MSLQRTGEGNITEATLQRSFTDRASEVTVIRNKTVQGGMNSSDATKFDIDLCCETPTYVHNSNEYVCVYLYLLKKQCFKRLNVSQANDNKLTESCCIICFNCFISLTPLFSSVSFVFHAVFCSR